MEEEEETKIQHGGVYVHPIEAPALLRFKVKLTKADLAQRLSQEMLLPVSGLYDFELILSQREPLHAYRQLLLSASLVFPVPLKLLDVSVPAAPAAAAAAAAPEVYRHFKILPAEEPLHAKPQIKHLFQPEEPQALAMCGFAA
ncbi:hypothetical protein, conserved [Eimeria necatrix]|uniref:Uncharacterized protein n=1 Tax=Eimeria necatrix TaxID=51315 RepID=U6MM18_9EIME|nr:hypothetical protein, conserved [Eimeria necatrix]CDJ64103.1 hypothetical protein, conserved [Eimeria necatrix]